jgi:hypothetical protein
MKSRKGDVRKGDVRKGDVRKRDVRKGDGNGKRKTRRNRNRNTRKIKRNTKIQKKYGAGDFRRRAEFTAIEAMRPLTIADFTKGMIMHKQRIISDVLVLEDPVYDTETTETQTDTLSIKLPTINLLTYEYFRDQLLKKLSLTLIEESTDSRKGQFNGVYIVKGDFDSDKKYALRISKNKFKFKPIYGEKPEGETFIEDYLEELELFAKLSQKEITPNVYYGGLFLTKGQQREQRDNNYYHFYSITEAFDNEIFAFIKTVHPNVSKLLEYLIGENGKVINLIDKFSKYGINCDCRSTNIVANKGITHLRMIDIDTKYYIEFDDLMELFEDDDYSYLPVFKDSDEDKEKIVMAISGDVMKYIFMLELISCGIEDNYLITKIKEILTPRNKCIFLFLFLKSFKFVRGIAQVVGPLLKRFGINNPIIVDLLFVDYKFINSRFKQGDYEYNNEEIYNIIQQFSSHEKRKLSIQESSSPEKRTKISRSSSE